jgi:EAL domain-containing protein (putative c-di-GMP-specific phosphodiesterase class I)
VELIAGLAVKMKLKVIAEGIVAARQVEKPIELGCQYGQGHYFSQAMDTKAAAR